MPQVGSGRAVLGFALQQVTYEQLELLREAALHRRELTLQQVQRKYVHLDLELSDFVAQTNPAKASESSTE